MPGCAMSPDLSSVAEMNYGRNYTSLCYLLSIYAGFHDWKMFLFWISTLIKKLGLLAREHSP